MANESVVVGQLTSSTSTKTTTWADWCDYCWLTVNRLLLLFSSPRGPFFILFKLTDSTASWATAAAKKETLLFRRLHNSLQSLLPSFYFCHQVRKSLFHIYRNQIALPLYRNNDLLKANKCWYTILLAKDWHYVEKFSSSQSLFKTFCLSSIKRHDFDKKANDYCTVVENHSQKSHYTYWREKRISGGMRLFERFSNIVDFCQTTQLKRALWIWNPQQTFPLIGFTWWKPTWIDESTLFWLLLLLRVSKAKRMQFFCPWYTFVGRKEGAVKK